MSRTALASAFACSQKSKPGDSPNPGFKADEIRRLRPGAYVARNLNTGGETRGKVF